MINFVKRVWHGEIELKYAFLIWLFQNITRLVVIGLALGAHDEFFANQKINYFLIVGYFLLLPIVVWAHVAFWRSCIKQSDQKIFKKQFLNGIYFLIKLLIIISAATTTLDYFQLFNL